MKHPDINGTSVRTTVDERARLAALPPTATTYDLVRVFFPDADDDRCHDLLWERTPYPAGGYDYICRSLAREARKARKRAR